MQYSNIKNEYTYNADSLESEDGSAKEKRQLGPAGEIRYIADSRQVMKNVIEGDTHTSGNQYVCHHRERCEKFEIPHKREDGKQRQQRSHVYSQILVRFRVIVHDLLDISRDKDDVHTATTNQINHQERINCRPKTALNDVI